MISNILTENNLTAASYTEEVPAPSDLSWEANNIWTAKTKTELRSFPPFEIGVSETPGRRNYMEDREITTEISFTSLNKTHSAFLFGVFDGHAGSACVDFVKENIEAIMIQSLEKWNPIIPTQKGIWHALRDCCILLDKRFTGAKSGTTAVIMLIFQQTLWTANVGDSRAFILSGENVIQITEDQKPGNPKYAAEIENLGGYVGYINGNPYTNRSLAMARSIGDHDMEKGISPLPEITYYPLSQIDTIVAATDGLFDVGGTHQIGHTVLKEDKPLHKVAEQVIQTAYNLFSRDNILTMIIRKK